MLNEKSKYIVLTSLSSIIYGIAPFMSVQLYQQGLTPLTLSFSRGFFAILFLGPIIKYKKLSFRIHYIQLIHIILISVLGTTLTNIFLNTSYKYIASGTATVIHFLYPFIVTGFYAIYLRQPFSKAKRTYIIIALLSLLTFIEDLNTFGFFGLFYALLSSFTYSFYMIYSERTNIGKINTFVLTFYISLFSALFILLINTTTKTIIIPQNIITFIILIVLSLSTQIIGLGLMHLGISEIGPVIASVISLLEPIVSVIIGFIFLNEPYSTVKIIGVIILIYSILMFVLKE